MVVRMKIASFILLGLLWLWFFGCIVTYRIGKAVLSEGMGIKSAEFIMLLLYSAGVLIRCVFPKTGLWVLLAILVFWLTVQFFCHWYYTIFGASPGKLQGYNRCFQNTFRLFPQNEKRVVPDLYHVILHCLLAGNIVLLCLLGFKKA